MDLKDFVAQTLSQIVEGVEQARAIVGEKAEIGGLPKNLPDEASSTQLVNMANNQGVAHLINFDVALTVESNTGGEGGAEAGLGGWLKVGGSAKHESSASSVSRVDFCIPLKITHQVPASVRDMVGS